jgi:hypothetical protein
MNAMVRQPADWMNMTLLEGMDQLYPGWRDRKYGELLRSPSTDWLTSLYGQYTGAPGQSGQHARRFYPGPHHRDCDCEECRRHRHHHRHHYHDDCHCSPCRPESCECVCCIGDVDMVVYVRVGEVRVIPLVVENERRREKSITVELGPWRTRGGGAAPVTTVSFEPKTFTLAPCAERELTITVKIDAPPPAAGTEQPRHDVDACLVATADLTLVGCDHRPVRIALAILPRDCDPFRIGCGCGCC